MDQVARVMLVTGATQGIGRAIALKLAQLPNTQVILVCRDVGRGEEAVREIVRTSGNKDVRLEVADLSDPAAIHQFRLRHKGPLHVLVNNAAECPRNRERTQSGLEKQFATNILGYHAMIREFSDCLREGHSAEFGPARVVNVASVWAGDLDLSDIQFDRRVYDNDTAYRQSKQADRMLAVVWAQKLSPDVIVNACHPGDPKTTLSMALGYNLSSSRDCSGAAECPVYLATHKDVVGVSGSWFAGCRKGKCRFAAKDMERQRQELFDLCETFMK